MAETLTGEGLAVVFTGRSASGVAAAARRVGGRGAVLDLASLESVTRFASEIAELTGGRPLHALVCIAGRQVIERSVTADGFETTFGVNHIGHVALIEELLRLTGAPSRLVIVASGVHDPAQRTGMPDPHEGASVRELAHPGLRTPDDEPERLRAPRAAICSERVRWQHGVMPARRFSQVDVFTAVPYRGNPVAVVLDAEGLETEAMQRFAHWTNLSETTFLLSARDASADYRLRIFTSAKELPFAGHPTLGSCHAWLQAGGVPSDPQMIVQECGAGLVQVRRADTGLAFAAPPLRRSGPVEPDLIAHVADTLGLDSGDIVDSQWVDNGPGWLGVLLDSAEAVLALRPGAVDLDIGVVGPYPAGSPEAFEVRAFFPTDGRTVEDPVTGSLNAALAAWLTSTGRATTPYTARQGTALGRLGQVQVSQDDTGTIWTGGGTITCLQGHAEL